MRRLRLRTLLIVLVLVTTVPIALFAAWLISRSSAQQEALIDRQNIEQARAIIVAVDQEIEDVIASLNVLALLEPIDARRQGALRRDRRARDADASAMAVDPADRHVAAGRRQHRGPPADAPLMHPEWAKQVIATGRPACRTCLQEPTHRTLDGDGRRAGACATGR